MAQLKDVYTAGKGMVGVILPDATTSARYNQLRPSVPEAGLRSRRLRCSDYKIDNASGTATTELALAQADITAGAKVLLVDPLR